MAHLRLQNVQVSVLILSVLGAGALFLIWLRDGVSNRLFWALLPIAMVVSATGPFFVPITRRVFIGATVVCLVTLLSLGVAVALVIDARARILPRPALTVDASYPTARPSQSKLWFAQGSWWAWFPDGDGTSLWRRRLEGWRRESALDQWLSRVPGRADVWAENGLVMAVLAHSEGVTIAGMRFDTSLNRYVPSVEPIHWAVAGRDSVESASIVRDSEGLWWIAYDDFDSVRVRRSEETDGKRWSNAIKVGGPTSQDDIAVLFPLPQAIGVAWSNQDKLDPASSRVEFREHSDGAPFNRWGNIGVVEQDFNTADDHFNAAVSPNGTVYLATKNQVDTPGKPQLVLRLRTPDGSWSNLPYADRTVADMPTRPIAVLGGEPLSLFLVHNMFPQEPVGRHYVVYRRVDTSLSRLVLSDTILIPQRASTDIRDPSSTRNILPPEADWVVVASDKNGNVYEGLLPSTPFTGEKRGNATKDEFARHERD